MGSEILENIKPDPRQRKLLPPKAARVLLDRHYIMAAAGVLSQHDAAAATALLLDSVGYRGEDVEHERTVRHH